jgi:anti-sigma factor RsiW
MSELLHPTDHDLERYFLGMITAEAELAPLEEHLFACPACISRLEETESYIKVLRTALTKIKGGW